MPEPIKEPSLNQILAILKTSKDLIKTPETWGKLVYDKYGKMCVVGAMMRATRNHGFYGVTCNQASVACGKRLNIALEQLHGEGLYLTTWQDSPERKHSEVMALMDSVIEQTEIERLKSFIKDAFREGWLAKEGEISEEEYDKTWRESLTFSRLQGSERLKQHGR